MLYETAARSAEVLDLNIEDMDLANCRAKVRRKGGAADRLTGRQQPEHDGGQTLLVFVQARRSRSESRVDRVQREDGGLCGHGRMFFHLG